MKKRINIVLILFVLGLWGTVIYRSVSRYLFPKEYVKESKLSGDYVSVLKSKDTFYLEHIDRDPFLNKDYVPKPASVTVKKVKMTTIPQTTTKTVKLWPAITYYGYIASTKSEKTILVKINQTIHKLKKNAKVDELVLSKVYNDSIEILFNKQKKIFKLNK